MQNRPDGQTTMNFYNLCCWCAAHARFGQFRIRAIAQGRQHQDIRETRVASERAIVSTSTYWHNGGTPRLGGRQVVRTSLAWIGQRSIASLRYLRLVSAVIVAVLWLGMRPSVWRRTTRRSFLRQCYFKGNQALLLILVVALMSSFGFERMITLLDRLGQYQMGFTVVVRTWVGHIMPGLASLIIIGRNCTSVTAELGTLQAGGAVRTLDRQGIDPFLVLVLPRVLAMAVTSLCLGLVFAMAVTGFTHFIRVLQGISRVTTAELLDAVLEMLTYREMIALPAKMVLTGLVGGAVCCIEGLRTRAMYVDMPRRVTYAFAICVVVVSLAHLSVAIVVGD
jgi:phospholipid/cholesterol/gamma-HCH transport system permease protein